MYTQYPERGFQSMHRRMSFSLGQRRLSVTQETFGAAQNWMLEYEGYDPKNEGLREALCTLGNGVFCTRGACEMSKADDIHYPGLYFNGYFDRTESQVHDKMITNEDLVNFPNWLPLTFKIGDDGEWHHLENAKKIENYKQWLNLKEGVLYRTFRITDSKDRTTTIFTRRFVHMGSTHIGAIDFSITPENWEDTVIVRSSLDASVKNTGVLRYRNLTSEHFDISYLGKCFQGTDTITAASVTTRQSHLEVGEAMRTRAFVDDVRITPKEDVIVEEENKQVHQILTIPNAKQGQTIRIEKICTIYGSKDYGITNVRTNACIELRFVTDFDTLFNQHKVAWEMLWARMDTIITPQSALAEENKDKPIVEQIVLRLHTFHCLQVLSTNSLERDVSVPARGLHGESYRGHIFWDELYIIPFYTSKIPEVARLIPKYRYKRINMARINAIKKGLHGALFPWQSGSDGDEETQKIHLNPMSGKWDPDMSSAQYHGNIAIAYNVLRYFDMTRDIGFMEDFGAEIVLEITKMFSSMAKYNQETERYDITGVMGPDEFHEQYPWSHEYGLRNNAYTNLMVVWLLNRSYQLLKDIRGVFRKKITRTLGISDELLRRWRDISHSIMVPFHIGPQNKMIISQFEGYEHLKELNWDHYREKYKNIGRLDRILKAEGDNPDNYKLSKQADVCMLFYLLTPKELHDIITNLGYEITETFIQDNVDYYVQRTSHGSTLSYLVHAAILYGIDAEKSWDFFMKSLWSDYNDIQGGTTPEGIHLAIMAGTVDIVQHKFAGLDMTRDGLSLNPCIPKNLAEIQFFLHWRNEIVNIRITGENVEIKYEDERDELAPVFLHGKVFAVNKKHRSKLRFEKYSCCGPDFKCSSCGRAIRKNDAHHVCRICANVYCPHCKEEQANNKLVLPQFSHILKPVRACDKCYQENNELHVAEPSTA